MTFSTESAGLVEEGSDCFFILCNPFSLEVGANLGHGAVSLRRANVSGIGSPDLRSSKGIERLDPLLAPVFLTASTIAEIDFTEASIANGVDACFGRFDGRTLLRGATIDGDLHLAGATLVSSVDITGSSIAAASSLRRGFGD